MIGYNINIQQTRWELQISKTKPGQIWGFLDPDKIPTGLLLLTKTSSLQTIGFTMQIN